MSTEILYCETGWDSLACRRNKHKIIVIHEMSNGISPAYLSALVPAKAGANVPYTLRNPNNIRTVQCHSELYYKSFLPSAIRLWNGLPEDTRNMSSASLKYHLNSNLDLPPKYYYEGSRLAQVYHSRLRTNCSSLNQHLHKSKIVPSPLCLFGSVEDTKHFLLTCPFYHNLRQEMLLSVSKCISLL